MFRRRISGNGGATMWSMTYHKIGTLESVYVDTGSDEPAFATVTVGLPTRHRLVFVPDRGHGGTGLPQGPLPAQPGEEAAVHRHRRELLTGDEEAVFKHYNLEYQPGRAASALASALNSRIGVPGWCCSCSWSSRPSRWASWAWS
jgi:hypothetical protein